jgi:hypothetical protein
LDLSTQQKSLSRLQIGVDVPWVTGWSEEDMAGVRPCPTVGGLLALHQTERPGLGRPVYSMNHCRRQRASVAGMLCPMCGEATSAGDRWTLTASRTTAGRLRRRGLGDMLPPNLPDGAVIQDAGSIAPLHKACADLAWSKCPHLIADRRTQLAPFAERWIVTPLLVEVAPPGGAHALLMSPRSPSTAVAFLQLYGVTDEVDTGWKRRDRR